jgi:PAS domain S-box-containing protein
MSIFQDEAGFAGAEKNLKLFSAAVESAMDGIQIVDFEGKIIFSNNAVQNIYGYTHEELNGKHVNDMNADPDFASKVILPSIQREGSWIGELMVKHKDGNYFPVWLNTSLVMNDKGEPIAMVGVIRDITERKKMEEALIQSEHRFRGAFENAAVGATMVDLKGRFFSVNKCFCDMVGYTEDELMKKTFSDITFPDDMHIGLDYMKEMVGGGMNYASFEKRYIRKDGQVINVIVSPALIRSKEGAPQHFMALFQEITERKKTEESLRLFSRAVENAIDGIQIVGTDRKIIYSNEIVEKMYGYTQEELSKKPVNEIMSANPDFGEKVILPSIKKTGSWSGESTGKRKDGTTFPVWLSISTILGDNNKPMAMVSVIRDISDIRRAEKRIVTLIDALPDIIYFKDTESRNLVVNQAFANLTGLKKEELEGKTDKELLPPALAEHCKKQDEEVMRGCKLMRFEEEHAFHGEKMFQETIKVPLHDERGVVTGLVGITRDITERKRAENELKKSEEKFRNLFESATDAIFILDLEGNFIDINTVAHTRLGYTKDEMLSMHIKELDPPEFAARVPERLAKVHDKGIAVFESAHIRKDGTVMPVEVSARMMEYEGRKVFFSIIRDITERKKADEAIKESEELMRLLIESAQDVIIMQDTNGRYTYYNANPSYGLKAEDILGKSPHDYHDKETAKKLMDRLKRVIESGESITEEVQIKWHGEPLWMHEQTSVVKDLDGNVRGVVTVSRNITEMKRLEEQLRHSQKMEAIGTLTAGIAHEFFNILTAIKGSAEFLDTDLSNDSHLGPYVNVINTSVDRATRLTQGLLMYSRKQLVKMEPIALNDVARHVSNLIAALAPEDIKLNLTCNNKGLEVIADRNQLEQVIMNLTVNAMDAMPNGGTLNINIEAADLDKTHIDKNAGIEPGRYALISVSDTGIGMDMKTQEKMFEPFFTTKDVGKGTGLGLSMVYGIVRKHNGYITVTSEPYKGTTFRIYLPLSDQKKTV